MIKINFHEIRKELYHAKGKASELDTWVSMQMLENIFKE